MTETLQLSEDIRTNLLLDFGEYYVVYLAGSFAYKLITSA